MHMFICTITQCQCRETGDHKSTVRYGSIYHTGKCECGINNCQCDVGHCECGKTGHVLLNEKSNKTNNQTQYRDS